MKILILNWRDIKNPEGGGAEILTHEMARRWVKWGHKVVQFSAMFSGGKKEEVIDGVKIIRRGSASIRSFHLPVHAAAFFWYLKNGRGQFDVVIDEIHGLPFFTPLYIKEKKIVLICEVAKEIWDVSFNFPLNKIGRLIEDNYFRFYRKIPFLTISSSTKNELMEKGVLAEDITILPMGLTLPKNIRRYPKEKTPTLIFVGRLTRSKGIEDAIMAVYLLKKEKGVVKLWIVGQKGGEYFKQLKSKIRKLDLEKRIIFWGFVSEEKKFELMSRAHILLAPSIKEGWGLTVPEAAAVGTPAVVYNVSGLRDSTKDGITGLICAENRPESLAEDVLKLWHNKKLYKRLQKNALLWAKKFSWDKAAQKSLKLIEG